ncbi:MAG: response regulator transcription factor [Clostridiales bacterium]|jgi:DNA-binding response OmpR family regulator|nr:response regulator transcription factor [Clostridiales bacterium]
MKILLIENDDKVKSKLVRLLTKNRFETFCAQDGETGLDEIQSGVYEAVILETELPEVSGPEVLRQIRKAQINTPVMLFAPKCLISEKVRGLDLGADDFVERPYADDELIARLKAITRRKGEFIFDNKLHLFDLTLDLGTYQLLAGEQAVSLSNKELEIMKYFFLHGHTIISKEELMTRLWGYDTGAENNLEVYISYLRRKMRKTCPWVQILCIKNVGYRLVSQSEDQKEAVQTGT